MYNYPSVNYPSVKGRQGIRIGSRWTLMSEVAMIIFYIGKESKLGSSSGNNNNKAFHHEIFLYHFLPEISKLTRSEYILW